MKPALRSLERHSGLPCEKVLGSATYRRAAEGCLPCATTTRELITDVRERRLMAETVSSRPRQEADFRCTSQGWGRSAVGEVCELALPAIMRRAPL